VNDLPKFTRRYATVNAHWATNEMIKRILLLLTLIACAGAVATGLYGVFKFPDAPIRQSERGYFGKGGTPRTQNDFEAFVKWQRAMFIVFPSAFVFGFAYGMTDSIQRRKRS
jgi:hypothetical protein